MARPTDPFAGFKLSEQTPLAPMSAGRDQRLFTAPPATSPTQTRRSSTQPKSPPDPMTSQRHDVIPSKRHDVTTSHPSIAVPAPSQSSGKLDLHETPHKDFTLRLTEAEYEALDDLEREIRRSFGITTSKNYLIRCGIHVLIDDHAQTKDRSVVLARLQAKPLTP